VTGHNIWGFFVMIAVHTDPIAFSAPECIEMLGLVAKMPVQDAGLVRQQRDHNLRRADLVWLDDVPGADWVMGRIIEVVRRANSDIFMFDINAFEESPQVARYDAAREGHFDWHSDIGSGPLAARRKLTMVVQLSDPSTYSGGELQLMPGAGILSASVEQGTAIVFPGFVLHRVTPVTTGTRYSLTVWAHGPAFR